MVEEWQREFREAQANMDMEEDFRVMEEDLDKMDRVFTKMDEDFAEMDDEFTRIDEEMDKELAEFWFDNEDTLMELQLPTYTYKARVIKVIDGDTIDVDLDVGLHITIRKRLRLLDIDAYEKRGEERELGLKATARMEELVTHAAEVMVTTVMDTTGKYGRLLATVWARTLLDEEFVNVNQLMITEGHAVPYE